MKCWSFTGFIFLWLLPWQVFSQYEFNVKLRSTEADVWPALLQAQQPGFSTDQITPLLRNKYAFLRELQAAAQVARQPDHELKGLLTLRTTNTNEVAARQALESSGLFEYVELNRTRTLHHLQVDPPNDDSVSKQWFHPFIRTFQAWDVTKGSPNVRIGILDTGLDYDHPEFQGQLAVNAPEDLNGNGKLDPWPNTQNRNGIFGDFDGLDNDGNGFADDVIGYDFTDQPRSPFGGDYLFPDPNPLDDNGHGTIVAGVAGAKANNGLGGAGIAPDCKLFIMRAFAANGAGEDDDIARAIIYAADNGVKILNFSFGDIYPSLTMHEAIKYAHARGVVMVSSAGNATGDELHYPSGYSEVLSVSASASDPVTQREFLWPFSSYGLTVDLCAPGSGIFTTALRDTLADGTVEQYRRASGTSLSAPMVAAAAGLLFAQRGDLTPAQVRGILTTTTDDISDPGWDHLTGAGRLNLERALASVASARVEITSPVNDRGTNRDTVYVVGSALDPEFVRYHVEFQSGTEDLTPWQPILQDQTLQMREDTLAMWVLTGLAEGEYTLRLRVERTNGASSEDRIRFIRDKTPPEIAILEAVPVWDNQERKHLIVFRANEAGFTRLLYRRAGDPSFRTMGYDRLTRNGEFLLGQQQLSSRLWEWQLEMENLAGLVALTPVQSFVFNPDFIPLSGYDTKPYTLPMGRPLERSYDFDQDQLPEVVMSRLDGQLGVGKILTYEYQGNGEFLAVDSVSVKNVLIPRDVADTDGDGLLELLASVNDSTYLLEQPAANAYPSSVIYTQFGDTLYASALKDTDSDGQPELIMKNFRDHFIYDRAGTTFQRTARLRDVSPDYEGSIAPRTVVGDFDGDGKTEVLFGDFDGDMLLYENTGPGQYELIWSDTTSLTKSGSYVTSGDFDGDGKSEFFTAVHPSPLRNEDFEYDAPFLWLRMFKSTANNTYEVVWQDYLYDLDTEGYNAVTAGNLDQDAAEELVFTTFPRTYILDYKGSTWEFDWFNYGDLASHHVIGDFDLNGVNEIGIGRGDSIIFREKNLAPSGPRAVYSLRGEVTGPTSVAVRWTPTPDALAYEIWRIENPEVNNQALIAGPLSGPTLADDDLLTGVPYLYLIRAVNPGLTPPESGFGNAVLLTPHELPRLDSVKATGPSVVSAWFSQPMSDALDMRPLFRLNNGMTPFSVITSAETSRRVDIGFAKPLLPGSYTLIADSTLLDAGFARMDPNHRSRSFVVAENSGETLILTRWETLDDKTAALYFNFPLTPAALDTAKYDLHPVGTIQGVEWNGTDQLSVKVRVKDARFGALGYPLSITVSDLCASNGVCLGEDGRTATFSSFKADLSEVFAYPNPVRNQEVFEGIRFANLTQTAHIEVLTVSGRKVTKLTETDGDGGYEWDLRDPGGVRLAPGVYLYRVYTDDPDIKEFVGKFAVVE